MLKRCFDGRRSGTATRRRCWGRLRRRSRCSTASWRRVCISAARAWGSSRTTTQSLSSPSWHLVWRYRLCSHFHLFTTQYLMTCAATQKIDQAYQHITQPVLSAIRKDLSAIIARLHRVDLGKPMDAHGAMGGGASTYMRDLVEKLAFIRTEILGNFNVGDASREWCVSTHRETRRKGLTRGRQVSGHRAARHPDVRAARLHRTAARREREAAADDGHDRARVRAERVPGRAAAEQAREQPAGRRRGLPHAPGHAVRPFPPPSPPTRADGRAAAGRCCSSTTRCSRRRSTRRACRR